MPDNAPWTDEQVEARWNAIESVLALYGDQHSPRTSDREGHILTLAVESNRTLREVDAIVGPPPVETYKTYLDLLAEMYEKVNPSNERDATLCNNG